MSEITESDITEVPTRYTITLTNGQTKQFDRPLGAVTVAASGAVEITMPGSTDVTWYGPSAWRSLEVRQLKT